MTRKLNFPRLSVKVLSALFAIAALFTATDAHAAGSTTLVISQIYGGGGNSGATWQNDYVEIFNRSASAVSLNGLSVQYASATTTTNASGVIPLPNVSMPAGSYYLIQMTGATTNGIADPVTPDLNNATTQGVNMSGTGGRVYISSGITAVAGASLCGGTGVIDFVGFGTTPVCAEGTPSGTPPSATAAPAPSVTTFDLRAGGGCTDTDVNSADFTAPALGSPSPHNSSSAVNVCGGAPVTTIPSGVGSATPNSVAQGVSTVLSVVVTPGTNPTSTGVAVTANLTAFGGSATQALALSGTANTYTYTLAVPSGQTAQAYTINATITDTQSDTVPVVPISLTVTSASTTTTTVSATPAGPTPNQSTTLTAIVTGNTTPTGSVTFKDGTTTLGSGNLSTTTSTTATATFAVTGGFTSGTHSITAVYVPTGIFTTSTSTALNLNVTASSFGSGIVITQMYGAGGNSGATINADYLELFNDSATPQTLTGWSVQYASAAGASVTSGNVWPIPTVTIPVGGYYLVGGATGANGVAPTASFDSVPVDNAIPAIGFGFAAGAGKVYLVSDTTPLASTAIPLASDIVDAITYGTGLTNAQGAAAPTPSTTLVDVRTNPCIDTNDGSDFTTLTVAAGTAHNSSTPIAPCGTLPPTASGTAAPSTVQVGHSTVLTVTVVPGVNPATTGLSAKANLTAFGGSATQAFTVSGTNPNVFNYTLAVPGGQAANSYPIAVTVTDTQSDTIAPFNINISVSALTPTNVVLSATPAAPLPNQSTVLTATITPSAATGTVVFQDNNGTIGTTGTVSGGVATTTISGGFAAGTHPLTAVYSGDSTYATNAGSLSLTVTAPVAPEFSLGLSNIQLILNGPVPTATTNVNVTAVGGLNSAISLACSGLPANVNCSFSPQTLTPNTGSNGAFVSSTMTLTMNTSNNVKPHFGKTSGVALGFALLAVPFALRRRKALGRVLALLVMLIAGAQLLTGCSGGGTPPGTETLTVTATAASGQIHTATITLITQ